MAHNDPLLRRLKTRREALGWSLKNVSDLCGIDETSLGTWEREVGSPSLDMAQCWAAVLGIKLALVSAEDNVRHGLWIDWDQRRVTVDGTPVRLTPMEWKGLERLTRTPGELVTHRALFQHLYGDERSYCAQSTAIRVLITKLRRLLPLHIEARWGQGYIVSGVSSSRRPACAAGDDVVVSQSSAPTPTAPTTAQAYPAPAALTATANPRPDSHRVFDLKEARLRRAASEPGHIGQGRAEELGVIERFLAERGVTRCPDVATIQHSPLPTLVWDKTKRKWVRPSSAACQPG